MSQGQEKYLEAKDIAELLAVMLTYDRPVEIDWVNRLITVLSTPRVDKTHITSRGPVVWQDVLYRVK